MTSRRPTIPGWSHLGRAGTVTLDELLADRARASVGLDELVVPEVADVGIAVESVRARDLMLPGELRQAASDVIVARERGRAELERARSETAALRSMANADRLIEEHPGLLQLRTLQAAGQAGRTVVVTPPAPAAT